MSPILKKSYYAGFTCGDLVQLSYNGTTYPKVYRIHQINFQKGQFCLVDDAGRNYGWYSDYDFIHAQKTKQKMPPEKPVDRSKMKDMGIF